MCRPQKSVVVVLFVAAVACGLSAAAADIPFAAQYPIASLIDGVYEVDAADMDNDGDIDLIASARNAGWLTWWKNLNGDGSSWQKVAMTSTLPGADSVAVADLDRDGDLDAVGVSYDNGWIVWSENHMSPTNLWTTRQIDFAYPGAVSVRPADINGDGIMDVLGASITTDTITWWESDGVFPLAWTEHTVAPGNIDGVRSVVAADIDRDGDLDVLAAAQSADDIIWYENSNGLGTSWIQRPVDIAVGGADEVEAVDIDNDGDLDIVGVAHTDDVVALWRNDGTPRDGGWIQLTIDSSFDYASSIAAFDLDHDGDLDLLATSYYGDAVTWWENTDGAAHLWQEHDITTDLAGAWDVSAADVDGDGDLDVFGASFTGDAVSWWRNETIHRNAVHPSRHVVAAALPWVEEARAVDFDGDGDVDILAATGSDNSIGWYENEDGSGGSWGAHSTSGTVAAASSVDAGDLDGDGDLDLVGSSYTDGDLLWWENPGFVKAPPWTSHTIEADFSGADYVRTVDMDCDGDLDLLAGSRWDGVAWFENTAGTGVLWSEHAIDSSVTGLMVDVADLDNDGDLDVASIDTDGISWYENTDGVGGAWATAVTVAPYFDDTETVRAADMDRDGDLDLVGSASFIGEISWWENVIGDGSSWTEHVVETSYSGANEAYPVDLDRDGDLDICASAYMTTAFACWENTAGDGSAWTRHETADETSANGVVPADVDGDGDPDLISAGRMNDDFTWWENRGGQLVLANVVSDGTQYVAGGDTAVVLTIVAAHAGRAGDADEELQEIVLTLEDPVGTPLTSSQANAVIESLALFRDDGSGAFDGGDSLVTVTETLSLVEGQLIMSCPPGDPDVELSPGGDGVLFVVLETQPDAAQHQPTSFRLSHLSTDSSGRDQEHDLPLVIQFEAAAVAEITTDPVLFADGFEDGLGAAWSAMVP